MPKNGNNNNLVLCFVVINKGFCIKKKKKKSLVLLAPCPTSLSASALNSVYSQHKVLSEQV